MYHLTPFWVKLNYAFVLQLDGPVIESTANVLRLLIERQTLLDSLNLQVNAINEARLVIHCYLEKDRVKHIVHQLSKVKGVHKLELLEKKI